MAQKSNAKKQPAADLRDLDIKIGFMEGLVRRAPDYVDALQILGDHYTRRGRYHDGLQVDERLANLEPQSPLVYYNLACSYSLTDDFARAIASLEKAIALGYRDFKWLARDPDLKKLRALPAFADLKDKIRRIKSEER